MEALETLRQIPLLGDVLTLAGLCILSLSLLRGLGLRPPTGSRRGR